MFYNVEKSGFKLRTFFFFFCLSFVYSFNAPIHANTILNNVSIKQKNLFISPHSGIGNNKDLSLLSKVSNDFQESIISKKEPGIEASLDEYKKDIYQSLLWVVAAVTFAGGIAINLGTTPAIEFLSGYVLELSLSIDNLFVFLLLFEYFKVDKVNQPKVLNYGIIGAVILRGLFIGVGSLALQQFHQVLFVFAIILFASSYKIIFSNEGDEEEDNPENNAIIQFSKKFFKTTDKFDEDRFFTVEKLATPLFLCLVCIEISDIVFAFDSVPAIFGVTENPFIVYTSNIFAISGLRSLYGVLSTAVSQLQYLEKAVGFVLGFIALKLATETFNYEIVNPVQSLFIVLGILGSGIFLSIRENKKNEKINLDKIWNSNINQTRNLNHNGKKSITNFYY